MARLESFASDILDLDILKRVSYDSLGLDKTQNYEQDISSFAFV